jgi:hypothetical protein
MSNTAWIPCAEKLPDYGILVLTYSEWDGYSTDYATTAGKFTADTLVQYEGPQGVTHWMPLPPPPKVE